MPDAAAREALLRLHVLFELEKEWQGLAPPQRHARRQLRSRRLVDDFFAWAMAQYARVKDARGLVATAFGWRSCSAYRTSTCTRWVGWLFAFTDGEREGVRAPPSPRA